MSDEGKGYLLAGQLSELERLQLQSRVWEPAGRALLAQLPNGAGRRALDIGCGVLGWLRLLSEWSGQMATQKYRMKDQSIRPPAR